MKYIGVIFSILLLLTAVSCDKKEVPTQVIPVYDTSLELLTSNDQALAAGSGNPSFIQIIVKNEINDPVEGVVVTFTQISTQDREDTSFNRTATTNATGTISLNYFADTLVGADTIQIVAEGAVDSLVLLALTVTPAAVDTIFKVAPLAPTVFGIAGELIADTFKVQILDAYSNPVANERVLFRAFDRCVLITDSTANLSMENDSIYTRTNTDGEAWAQVTLSINPRSDGGYPNSFNMMVTSPVLTGDTIAFVLASTDPGTITYYGDVRNIFDDNCILCHPTVASSYDLTRYFTTVVNPIVIPGDTINSTMLNYAVSTHQNSSINVVEEDKVKLWIGTHNAVPGSSGLVSYTSHIKNIIDANCLSCHGDPPGPSTTYMMTTHAEIRANDVAIPADTNSTLVLKLNPGGNMRTYVSDVQADSIINWVVSDSLRQY
ncbi:MAG: hypothetical protein KAR42_01335 [candidate division Zixibacteria bacterium]|nr:hypothetical protein [candidate division Zixibacteria bacterium]